MTKKTAAGRTSITLAGEYLWPVHDENGCYETYRVFGPVAYRVIAITKARMARHRAEDSYWGCVTPDEAGSDA